MLELSVCSSTGTVLRKFELGRLMKPGQTIKVGRADDCEIRIKANQISRHHLEIEAIDDDEWVIRDLGSTTGSFVQGKKISELEVRAGLEVMLGPAILRFDDPAARIAAEIARELAEEDQAHPASPNQPPTRPRSPEPPDR